MADIFLSYAEQDRDKARQIADALSAVGWDVWWDRRIPAGKTWREVLEAQLKSMRCMVVLWSKRSVSSDWVCEEAAEGRKLHKLVPVLIETIQPPVGFRELQAADLAGWDGSSNFIPLQELLSDIERQLGKPRAPAGAPPPALSLEQTSTQRRWKAGAGAAALTLGAAGMVLGLQLAGVWQKSPGETNQPRATPTPTPGPAASTRSDPLSGSSATHSKTRSADVSGKDTSTPTAPRAEAKPTAAATKAQCDRLKERLSVGETLAEESRTFYLKECSR